METITFTAAEFTTKLLSKSLPKQTIHVTGKFTLPRHIKRLPPNVSFEAFVAMSTELRSFNHVVLGRAAFYFNHQLRHMGPKARFGSLHMEDCRIERFNNRVEGECCFPENMSKLKVFGPKCYFGGSLNARGTRIREFNHEVHGEFASFSFNKSLKLLGPKARFHGWVCLHGTRIAEFDHYAAGDVNFIDPEGNGTPSLKRIGPNAHIKGYLDIRSCPVKEMLGKVEGELRR